ncbi:hypothetical protein PINS_up023745 [Pythium insidiosum]|nr:hypothetical protein PINS_up023745 [Pythium insidiosum]
MGFPPPETKEESLLVLGGVDPLGVEVSAQQLEQIRALEASDHPRDVHRAIGRAPGRPAGDAAPRPAVPGTRKACLPSLFVLMGDFLSTPVGAGAGSTSLQDLKDYLDELGNLILKYPKLAEFSKFVLVPGPTIPAHRVAFPRHPVSLFDESMGVGKERERC